MGEPGGLSLDKGSLGGELDGGGGGVESQGAGDEGPTCSSSSAAGSSFISAAGLDVFFATQTLKCFGSWAKWMERPRRVSKLRPHEHKYGGLEAGDVPFPPFRTRNGDVSLPSFVLVVSMGMLEVASLVPGCTEVALVFLTAAAAEEETGVLAATDEGGALPWAVEGTSLLPSRGDELAVSAGLGVGSVLATGTNKPLWNVRKKACTIEIKGRVRHTFVSTLKG